MLFRSVLAAKHTASLQLLCTVGGNHARLDARTEFEISKPALKGSWSCTSLYCRNLALRQDLCQHLGPSSGTVQPSTASTLRRSDKSPSLSLAVSISLQATLPRWKPWPQQTTLCHMWMGTATWSCRTLLTLSSANVGQTIHKLSRTLFSRHLAYSSTFYTV